MIHFSQLQDNRITLWVAVIPYTLDCSISFLPPQQTLFSCQLNRAHRSTGSFLLCKKDLSPFTCFCVIFEIRGTCSLSTKCADPLLKNRSLRSKPTPVNSVCVSMSGLYVCVESESALSWFGLTQWEWQQILLLTVLLRQRFLTYE